MSLFADTSGLYALLVATEADHDAVRAAFRRAVERGRPIVTTNYVVVEVSALLQHRIGLAPVRDLQIRLLPVLSVRFVDERLHRRGFERLFRLDRRRVSLVDAVSFEVLDDEGISDVLGLDRHFTEQGFRLIP